MRIGKLFGIDIIIHVSWLFIFALVAWSLSSELGPLRLIDLPAPMRIAIGLLTALLFFVSVLVHELAHSLLARSRGIPISGITLFIFGGVSMFEGEAQSAPLEAWISGVGPLTSLLLGGIFALLAHGVASVAGGTTFALGCAAALMYLGGANVLLAIFNILPAFPLDGGRVLHALVWRLSGDRLRATRITVAIGRIFAGLIIAFGIVETLFTGLGGGLWLTFIGWFLLQAGNVEGAQAEIGAALRGHTAGDVASLPPGRVAADETGAAALRALLAAQVEALPVYLGERFIGLVGMSNFAAVPADELAGTYVTAMMTRAEDLPAIGPEMDAAEALRELARSKRSQLAVIRPDGSLAGFFSRDALLRLVAH